MRDFGRANRHRLRDASTIFTLVGTLLALVRLTLAAPGDLGPNVWRWRSHLARTTFANAGVLVGSEPQDSAAEVRQQRDGGLLAAGSAHTES